MPDLTYVINTRGEREPFSFRKIYQSAKRAGASRKLAQEIAQIIQKQSYSGVKTSEIFRKIRKLLSRREPVSAIKFSLKQGMRKLGPTGFPFEKYIGEVLLRNGFKVRLNQYIPGFCCKRYEIDFLAQKKDLVYVGECKYRNLSGGRVHSDIALSNYARFLDTRKGKFFNKKQFQNVNIKSLLVTNTKFTSKAIRYSECVGVELLGWNYPRKRGLEYLIDSQRLYPVTILPSLTKNLAEIFASRKKMLVQDIFEPDVADIMRKTKKLKKDFERLRKEADMLLRV